MANAPPKYPSSAEEFRAMFPKSGNPQDMMILLDGLSEGRASSKFGRPHLELFRVIHRQQDEEQMEQFFGLDWDAAADVIAGDPVWDELKLYSQAALEQRPVAELQSGAPHFGAFYAHLAQLFVPLESAGAGAATAADSQDRAHGRLRPCDAIQTPKSAGFVSGAGLGLSGSDASSSGRINRHRPGEDDVPWTPESSESTRSTHYSRAKSEAATVQVALDFLTTVVSLATASRSPAAHPQHRQLEWTPSTTTFDVQIPEFEFTAINDGSLARAWHDGSKRVRDNHVVCSLEAKNKYASWLADGVSKAPLPDSVVAQWVAQLIGMISQNVLGEVPAATGEVFLISATANYLKLVRATYSPAYIAYLKRDPGVALDQSCFLELTEWPECNMANLEGRLRAATFVIAVMFHLEGQ